MSRILVVEDDPGHRGTAAATISNAPATTSRCSRRGRTPCRACVSGLPDLLILDRMLPGVDGLEICRLVRASPAMADLPVMMVTARAEESDRIVGLELGADDYITKPFSAKEVVARVQRVAPPVGAHDRGSRPASSGRRGRVLQYGEIRMDLEQHVVTVDGRTCA